MINNVVADAVHISIKAEPVFNVGGVNITNSVLMIGVGLVVLLVWLGTAVHKVKRGDNLMRMGFFSRLAVWCFSGLYKTCKEGIPDKRVCRFIAPIAITMFFYIGIQYYVELLPIVGEAIMYNDTAMLRGPVADLNFTFALAIVAIIAIQIAATIIHGFRGNIGRYLRNPLKDPIGFFEGLLEIVAEFSRLISLSMRLFGNVLAGEVLIVIVSWLAGYVSPAVLPFIYIFEMFIGGIQAYVFFSLTVVFAG